MAKRKISKLSKRRLLIFGTVSLVLVGYFVVSAIYSFSKIYSMNKQNEFLMKKLEDLKDEEQYLKTEIVKLQDPDYVARYAREKYLYSKDGEYIIRIPD